MDRCSYIDMVYPHSFTMHACILLQVQLDGDPRAYENIAAVKDALKEQIHGGYLDLIPLYQKLYHIL
jgi:hypothetical protein